MLIIITANIIAPAIKKKRAQPLIPCAVTFMGCPHFGHEVASFETTEPHSGQLISAIIPPSLIKDVRVYILSDQYKIYISQNIF
jgi:hypothetical protein